MSENEPEDTESDSAEAEPPEPLEMELKRTNNTFQVWVSAEVAEYHGFEGQLPVEFRFNLSGQYLTFECEVDPSNPVTSRTRNLARPKGRDGGATAIRPPRNPLIEAGFDEYLDRGETVTVTLTSHSPGRFELSFAPPIQPLQILADRQKVATGSVDEVVLKNPSIEGQTQTLRTVTTPRSMGSDGQGLYENRDGEDLDNTAYRAYIRRAIDEAYGGLVGDDEPTLAAFNLAIFQGQLALAIDIGGEEVDNGQPHVNRFFSHTAVKGDEMADGSDYNVSYLTFPRDYVTMLGWEGTELQVVPLEGAMVVYPAQVLPSG